MQNAILDAKKTPEIITTFENYYDETAIAAAFEVLGLKRSARKRDRKIDLDDLLNHLRKEDWKGKNVRFAAVDFKKICQVPSGIGDELNLRYELIELRTKFNDMTAVLEDVKNLGKNVQIINDTFAKALTSTELVAQPKPCNSLKTRKPRVLIPRPPPTPPPSQIHAMKNNKSDTDQDISNEINIEETVNDQFTLVTRRKRSSGKIIVGVGNSAGLKSVSKPLRIKTGMILVSRCDPETTCDDVTREIEKLQKNTGYKLHGVETWRSRYQTYSSFKVTYELGEKPLQQFLNELLYDDNVDQLWPAGVLVKSFRPVFVKRSFYKNA